MDSTGCGNGAGSGAMPIPRRGRGGGRSSRLQPQILLRYIPIYQGYLDINFFDDKSVHYVFFESQNDVSKDPLVVWLSGGPGCSSLLGAFHENGPFIFYPGAHNLKLNNNSWNKNANMLYL